MMPVSSVGYVNRLKVLPLPLDAKRYGPPRRNLYLFPHRILMEWKHSIIHKMDIKDLDEVLAIEAHSSPTPWSKNMFSEEMQNAFSYCFVIRIEVESKQPVIGFICFRNIAEESELLNLAVHPHYRRLGVGIKLMQFYIDFSSQRGVKAFHLEVNSSNQSAIHLYQRCSYQSFGMRKKFYQKQFDALLMVKRLSLT